MKKTIAGLLIVAPLAFGHYAVLGRPLEKFHLSNVHNQLRVDEAQEQANRFPGKIDAELAVTLALESFLTDSSHIESPLALASQKTILYRHFNQYSTEIRFVSFGEEPEHGETVELNWIIRLKIPTLSDHIFWAVIDRQGLVRPYNYGFN
jgi:hypothetical protein